MRGQCCSGSGLRGVEHRNHTTRPAKLAKPVIVVAQVVGLACQKAKVVKGAIRGGVEGQFVGRHRSVPARGARCGPHNVSAHPPAPTLPPRRSGAAHCWVVARSSWSQRVGVASGSLAGGRRTDLTKGILALVLTSMTASSVTGCGGSHRTHGPPSLSCHDPRSGFPCSVVDPTLRISCRTSIGSRPVSFILLLDVPIRLWSLRSTR